MMDVEIAAGRPASMAESPDEEEEDSTTEQWTDARDGSPDHGPPEDEIVTPTPPPESPRPPDIPPAPPQPPDGPPEPVKVVTELSDIVDGHPEKCVPVQEVEDGHLEQQDDGEHEVIMGYLGKITDEAEARLAARRQARAEAREIRMRELERQQREAEQTADRAYDLYSGSAPPSPAEIKQQKLSESTPVRSRAAVNAQRAAAMLSAPPVVGYQSSRRSSEDSMEDGGSLKDVRQELKEMEEKCRKVMFHNAQLDNEKSSFMYQVELLKDQIEQLEEAHTQLQREHRDKCREHEQLKRDSAKVKVDMELYKSQLEERDRLIQEAGLVIVGEDVASSEEEESSSSGEDEEESSEASSAPRSAAATTAQPKKQRKALVSAESAQLLDDAGEGSLDVRLRKFMEERNELQDQVRHYKLELEEERSRHSKVDRRASGSLFSVNGPDGPELDSQREASKQLGDYKFKLQKAEQDISTLQANVARLESQVIRYKAAAESSEKAEEELKTEKRKLQRELREAQVHVEELETANTHLVRRLDKLKNAKSTLLKEL